MIRTSPWPAGTPCWADLAAPDVPAAQAFYSSVVGWDWTPVQVDMGDYTNAHVEGHVAAGLFRAHEGTPVAWTLHLATDDAAASAAAVTAGGGEVLDGPVEVGPLGTMVLARDPSGARFGLWQAGTHLGTTWLSAPGALGWEDLRSSDPATATAFYDGLFGFDHQAIPMAGDDYTTFHLPGDPAPLGGMGGLMGHPGPSHWLVYWAVADVDAAQ